MPQCTVEQHDDHSSGPFALRDVEILLGYQIERDLQCPFAVRNRHARTVFKAITNSINRIERSSFIEGDYKASGIKKTDKADFVPKPVLATSSGNIPKTPVTSTRSSPGLEIRIPHSNLELTAPSPSPVLEDVDDPQDQEKSPIHLKGTRGIPKELVSTLKVAQEEPKPRPRPQYHGWYHMPLPGDEDGDFSTVLEHDNEESDQFVSTRS